MLKIFKFIVLFVITLNAQSFNISSSGWHLLGAIEEINTSSFNNKCIDYIWAYKDGEWSLFVTDNEIFSYKNKKLNKILEGDGFWVLANSNSPCEISTSDSKVSTPNVSEEQSIVTADMELDEDGDNIFETSYIIEYTLDKNKNIINVKRPNYNKSINYDDNNKIISLSKSYIIYNMKTIQNAIFSYNSDGSIQYAEFIDKVYNNSNNELTYTETKNITTAFNEYKDQISKSYTSNIIYSNPNVSYILI